MGGVRECASTSSAANYCCNVPDICSNIRLSRRTTEAQSGSPGLLVVNYWNAVPALLPSREHWSTVWSTNCEAVCPTVNGGVLAYASSACPCAFLALWGALIPTPFAVELVIFHATGLPRVHPCLHCSWGPLPESQPVACRNLGSISCQFIMPFWGFGLPWQQSSSRLLVMVWRVAQVRSAIRSGSNAVFESFEPICDSAS